MLFFYLYLFFYFLCSFIYKLCFLNIARATKKMYVNEIKDFIFENYYKRIGFSKGNSYYSMKRLKKKDLLLLANKLIEKISDLHNFKEHYRSFIRKTPAKSVKQLEIITYQPKTFENPNVVDINYNWQMWHCLFTPKSRSNCQWKWY